MYGVSLGVGASYATKSMSSSQSVYVMALASKMSSAPISLPDNVPRLTNEALTILKGKDGIKKFEATYGTHFIVGENGVLGMRPMHSFHPSIL